MRATVIAVVLLVLVAVAAWFLRGRLHAPEQVSQAPSRSAAAPAPKPAPPAPAATGTVAKSAKTLEKEARQYVHTITETERQPVPVQKADHFVTGSQEISLIPESSVEVTTPKALLEQSGLKPGAPITVVKSVEQIVMLSPEKVIAESGGNLDKKIRVMSGDKVKEVTVRQVLEEARKAPGKAIAVVKNVDYYEVTTPKQLESSGVKPNAKIRVILKPYHLEQATVPQLVQAQHKYAPGTVFYVRTVRNGDDQGIWGIVHHGLVDNFARGIAIRRGQELNTYQVKIPMGADQLKSDQSSSFLGKLIQRKTLESYVYNFRDNRMGHNPNRIYPGQELVIINFSPDELINIYKHFVSGKG